MTPRGAVHSPASSLALALALALPAAAAAQGPAPLPPSPIEAAAPALPEWPVRVSFHAAGGALRHALDPDARRVATMTVGVAFNPETWVHLEAEVATARLEAIIECPAEGAGCPPDPAGARLVTLLTGIRVALPTQPAGVYVATRSGLELSRRWDYKFVVGDPPAGTALTLGLTALGGD